MKTAIDSSELVKSERPTPRTNLKAKSTAPLQSTMGNAFAKAFGK
jgi:hypothetical protein